VQAILDLVQKLGPQRLAAMGAVTLSLAGFFVYVVMRLGQPNLAQLYADLAPAESAAIVRELDTRGIRYELRGDGSSILAPREGLARLRMDLAAKGMPASGGVGYEIFDKGDSFSSTSFVQNINQIRALEGELARSIRALDRVQSARVHLAIPERRLFQKDRPEPRASIVLKVRGELEATQVRAIRHLVATAVDGLKPSRISLVDEAGRLLADGTGDDADTVATAADRQQSFERKLKTQVEDIVASVVGRGRARVQIAADYDLNRIQQTAETFDPDSRVVRSTQIRNEANTSAEGREGQVTVANEVPGAARGDGAGGTREQGQKNEETINYEISRTTRTETLEAGRLKRLSVAVLVDGIYAKGANGGMTYAPRNPEELQRIATLVRLGIGFNKERGDQVEVVNLPFAEAPATPDLAEPGWLERLVSFGKEDILRLAETGVLLLTTLIVLLFVVRPLLRQVLAPPPEAAPATQTAASAGTSAETPATPPSPPATPALPQLDTLGARIASQPEEAANILKNWLRSAA
jgi:flagellar M-ring protein FliF